MSYSKVNKDQNTSLIDHEDDLIQHDDITAQPYIVPDIEPDHPQPSGDAPAATAKKQNVIQPQVPINSGNAHIFQINFYRQFFDLDTDQFISKLQRALNPLDNTFSDEENGQHNTELYGFIWITGTLIFLMFVSSTGSNILSSWIHGPAEGDGKGNIKYEYKFDLLRLSIGLFYGYNLFVPFGLYAITSWFLKFPHKFSFTELISIYGYTNILWVPITFVNFIIAIIVSNEKHSFILNVLEWVIVLLSGLVTGASNLVKISPILKKNLLILQEGNPEIVATRYHLVFMGLLAVSHLIFTIIVKVCFFGFD